MQIPFEQMVIPDYTHHFIRGANWLKVNAATAASFDKQFGVGTGASDRVP